MALQFVLGSSGSGKTTYMYNEMIQQSIKAIDAPILMIVPEQFTLQTQQDIIRKHSRNGIMNIEILSFQRLAYRLYDDLLVANKTILKDTGKSMVIRKLVEDHKNDYAIIHGNIKKNGYINELKDLITEFYQYNIDHEAFQVIKEQTSNPLLHAKLNDLELLFNSFKGYLSGKYMTTETTLDLLVDVIMESTFLENATIYLDGFYGFTPIQYKIIRKLLKKVVDVKVGITVDSNENISDIDDECQLFFESKKTIHKLKTICEEEGVLVEKPYWLEDTHPVRYEKNKALLFLEKNLYRYHHNTFDGPVSGLQLCKASNMRKEVKYVADAIMKLVQSNGYRYKDIGVLSSDIEGYESIIKQTFGQYDIPYFVDKKESIKSHPLVEFILSALETINRGFMYSSIFRYIKTGMLGIKREDIYLLENYVLAYGIRGENYWNEEWEKPYPLSNFSKDDKYLENLLERINGIREQIIVPLVALKQEIAKPGTTARSITKALYTFLETQQVQKMLEEKEKEFEKKGELLLQKRYGSLYKLVIEILDQMVDILGDDKISLKEYTTVLEAGFVECQMGLVPPGLDQVVVGDLERTRIRETKAMFVIGLNEGKIPKTSIKPGLITDKERLAIKACGIEVAPDNVANIYKEQFSIYMGIVRTSQRLYLSYANTDLDGKSMRPSILFYNVKKFYKTLQVINIDEIYHHRLVINRPKETFSNFINKIANHEDLEKTELAKEVYVWLNQQEGFNRKLAHLERAIDCHNTEKKLEEAITESLYGVELNNSVSRLETFSRCPFSHFVDYGLRLNERLEYEVKMPDIGILFHQAIDLVSKKIANRNLSWHSLDREMIDQLVDESVNEVVEREKRSLFTSSHRNIYLVKKIKRITKRAILAIKYQITKGEFKPTEYEYTFDGEKNPEAKALTINLDSKKTMKLKGRIDRLDTYEDEENLYLSVIDYKSGNKKIDMVSLYYGLQLQLFVYLNGANEMKQDKSPKNVVSVGAFYFHIDDPIIDGAKSRNSQEIEKEIFKSLKLSGLVLNDQDIIHKLDHSFESASDVIPVTIKKDGSVSAYSSVATREEFEAISRFTHEKNIEIGKDIARGDVSIRPYKLKDATGCDYCEYKSICQFENGINGNAFRKLIEMNDKEVYEKIVAQFNEN
jgi:ATP-dependent helicase/nuclease subunit B